MTKPKPDARVVAYFEGVSVQAYPRLSGQEDTYVLTLPEASTHFQMTSPAGTVRVESIGALLQVNTAVAKEIIASLSAAVASVEQAESEILRAS